MFYMYLKKNVYSATMEWNVGSVWYIVLFKPVVSLFSVWMIYQLRKVSIVVPYHYCIAVIISSVLLIFALYL